MLEFIKFIDQGFVTIMRYITSHAVKIYYVFNYVVVYYNFWSYWMFVLNDITFMYPDCVSNL
jgi:hypothetical protein